MKKYILIFVLLIISIAIFTYRNIISESYIDSEVFVSDTFLTITASTTAKKYKMLTNDIIKEIERNDNILNAYNAESEISKINKLSLEGNTNIAISKEIAHLFSIGMEYSKYTDGRYDIALRELIELWGFGIRKPSVPDNNDIKNVLKNTGCHDASIITNNDEYYLQVNRKISFDLGSYGKGYILEKIKDILSSYNIENYLLNYGGDIILNGVNRKNNPWVVAVKNPRDEYEQNQLIIQSTNASIVTSGDYERYFMENNKRYHHILDATTGYPAYNSISATIVADNPTEADILSTAAFILGTNFYNKNIFKNIFNYKQVYIITETNNELFIYEQIND